MPITLYVVIGVGSALYLDMQLTWIRSCRNAFCREQVSSFLDEVDVIV